MSRLRKKLYRPVGGGKKRMPTQESYEMTKPPYVRGFRHKKNSVGVFSQTPTDHYLECLFRFVMVRIVVFSAMLVASSLEAVEISPCAWYVFPFFDVRIEHSLSSLT